MKLKDGSNEVGRRRAGGDRELEREEGLVLRFWIIRCRVSSGAGFTVCRVYRVDRMDSVYGIYL